MKTNRQEKQEFYSDSETVKKYEELRFSNAGGQFVHQSEVSLFSKFLNICSLRESILDIPCGTGRMLPTITASGFKQVYAADYSDEMLAVCNENPLFLKVHFSKQDIYSTTYPKQQFSVVLSSRFLFHCDDQDRLFSEFERLIAPEGYLIFDSLRWSPRTWTRLFSEQLGGDVYTNSTSSIYKLADAHGFEVIDSQVILLFPSFVYNFIPGILMRPLIWLESIWPSLLKTKQVWILKKR
ncbi:TPA: class I SAM-dependent methyltransferase [Vibrio parahaemolyticus]|uniref:class I SAM-dependent methyltransferase n=1 Tax=Vibrio parahaemolyticus TaxID=670 RepID=UPI001124ADF1|nr:class I SAM-dependent methyltransferase [Vibrio parahaemolyticus]MBE5176968.1 class I SAM-dependent methyltransferase [Vibrio parahaemolyticus]TOI30235.1 SAM-dependent methyltransferase [Vibrio parahaemolyticus]HAS6503401.1 methyltransferase domain-containing protein [Vibrio parahaemolyticus]HCE4546525.1 class I SAM-dependent methyltransferase [Vibrio parahaemolyticus]